MFRFSHKTVCVSLLTLSAFTFIGPLSVAQERLMLDGSLRIVETQQANEIRQLLEAYERGEYRDIAAFKLAIDKTIDPDTPVEAILGAIDRAVDTVRAMAGPDADEAALYRAMQRFVYEPGIWNENNAFSYDHDDPLGLDLNTKLLGTYLTTRRGNCVSMPTLILILGRRLGMDMTFAYAPNHVFIKFKPEGATDYINIEATSGANPARDTWIRQSFEMSDQAIENGVFMRPLSEMELAAAIAVTAMEHASQDQRHWDLIRISKTIEAYDQIHVAAMLFQANGYMGLMVEDYHRQFPNPKTLPHGLFDRYTIYRGRHQSAVTRASQLGIISEVQNASAPKRR